MSEAEVLISTRFFFSFHFNGPNPEEDSKQEKPKKSQIHFDPRWIKQ